MRAILMVVAMLTGCVDGDDEPWTAPDGGMLPPDAHHDPGDILDFFGETCRSDPFPANTVCHADRGWCVDNVCHPMCVQDRQHCPGAAENHTDAGACYCTQQ